MSPTDGEGKLGKTEGAGEHSRSAYGGRPSRSNQCGEAVCWDTVVSIATCFATLAPAKMKTTDADAFAICRLLGPWIIPFADLAARSRAGAGSLFFGWLVVELDLPGVETRRLCKRSSADPTHSGRQCA